MPDDEFGKNKLDFLIKAIDDTQNTVRFTDAKAGAVITFWGIVFTVLNNTKSEWYDRIAGPLLPLDRLLSLLMLFVATWFLLGSVWLAISVLIPKSAPSMYIDASDVEVDGLFFLHEMVPSSIPVSQLLSDDTHTKLKMSSKEYFGKIKDKSDAALGIELIVELQKVSFIRNIKIARVNKAILYIRNFLIIVFLMTLYFFLKQMVPFNGGNRMVHFHVNVELFIVLYIAHKVADYLFQTDKQATMKSTKFDFLILHCILYTVVLIGAAYVFTGYFQWAATVGLFASHLVLDNRKFEEWWAKVIKRVPDPASPAVQSAMSELDQAFHYLVLFLICLFP